MRQQLHLRSVIPALFEKIDFLFRLDGDLLHLALAFGAVSSGSLSRVFLEEELQLLVGVADLLAQRAPESPMQTDGALLLLIHELIERAERERVAGRRLDGHGVARA